MPSNNITMLQTVANGLGELKEDMVFVGGSVAELYATDPAASDIRPTMDVDCVIELSSRRAHAELEENLRARRFQHDTSQGAPICRWVFAGVIVDVMPTDADILGFSNPWYPGGIENKIIKILPDGTEIYVFSPAYYLAAKFVAHDDRGGNDLRASHDFEDIIYILSNCTEIVTNIQSANDTVKTYLKRECQNLLDNDNLIEGIETALPYESGEESTDIILDLITNIAEVE